MFVEEVLDLVELNLIRDALVGLPGVDGLSTEQRKRLTIAVELVANPSIIFMDEPTSGLDARAAAIVMRTVRNTVDTGRTVVCTIHQPSIDIFESFDEVHFPNVSTHIVFSLFCSVSVLFSFCFCSVILCSGPAFILLCFCCSVFLCFLFYLFIFSYHGYVFCLYFFFLCVCVHILILTFRSYY